MVRESLFVQYLLLKRVLLFIVFVSISPGNVRLVPGGPNMVKIDINYEIGKGDNLEIQMSNLCRERCITFSPILVSAGISEYTLPLYYQGPLRQTTIFEGENIADLVSRTGNQSKTDGKKEKIKSDDKLDLNHIISAIQKAIPGSSTILIKF